MSARQWDARIERAHELEAKYPFAAEGLRFYQRVAASQKSLYDHLASRFGMARKPREPRALRHEFDLAIVLPHAIPFFAALAECAPSSLAQRARELRDQTENQRRELLTRFWTEESAAPAALLPPDALLARLFLQPCAEYLADCTEPPAPNAAPSSCPLCNCLPQVGVLRPAGDGAKRSLLCSLCAHEWEFRRLVCVACGEEDPQKLAVYTAEEFPHVRVEACDTCHRYLKTVDLTKDGRAFPVVDELATIPLDLWAAEHGYEKIQLNLLGV
jgi:formate dehydrogenase accessory protein FdhE